MSALETEILNRERVGKDGKVQSVTRVVSELGEVATQKDGRSDDPASTIAKVAKVAIDSNHCVSLHK